MVLETWIVALAVIGGIDSLYTALQQLFPKLYQFCFTSKFKRVNCYEILHSRHAKLFWIPNTWMGIIFYAMISLIYNSAPVFASVGAERLYLTGAIISTLGLLVGYYLLYVQARVLKKYCIFCLTSTTILTVITIMAWTLV